MMHIIYAVIAVALTVLVTFGGVSYMRADAPVRIITSRGLVGQYEAILLGVSAYRSENNGLTPKNLESFSGYLPNGKVPSFGIASEGFDWTLERPAGSASPAICLKVDLREETRLASASVFAMEAIRRGGEKTSVTVGESCGSGLPFVEGPVTASGSTVYFTMKGF